MTACLGTAGRHGCAYAQPLEAFAHAIARTRDRSEPEFGFLRPEADFLLIIATDDADCSVANPEAFDPEGNRALWSDPQAESPTPAVCWNAGVQCSGDPSGYDQCVAVDRDANGEPTTAENAVLHPVDRYVDILEEIRAEKQLFGTDVFLLSIVGFGENGLTYHSETPATEFELEHGIAPGCTYVNPAGIEVIHAVPPVRLYEFSERARGTSPRVGNVAAYGGTCSVFQFFDDVVEGIVLGD